MHTKQPLWKKQLTQKTTRTFFDNTSIQQNMASSHDALEHYYHGHLYV